MSDLLTTEADRRRVRMEIERGGAPASSQPAGVTAIADYRERLARREEWLGQGSRRNAAQLELEPVAIGPTWQRDPKTGEWLLPERTLGWEVLGWTAEYLRQPDGPDAGEPWRYTDEQARFILWWFADRRAPAASLPLRDAPPRQGLGQGPGRRDALRVEFVGPCRFAGWDANGDPSRCRTRRVGADAAVAKDQTRNTMTLFPGLFSDAALDEYSIDLGKEIIYAHGGRCRLEPSRRARARSRGRARRSR
jgi:hypothetical protein